MSAVLAPRLPDLESIIGEQWRDPWWRLSNLYWIVNKAGKAERFTPNAEQTEYYQNLHFRNLILKVRQLGFCLAPETRILTADLKWVALDELPIGAEVIAVDESVPGGKGAGRKMRTGVVQAKRDVFEPAYRLRMSNGESLTLTPDHRMLCRARGGCEMVWRKTKDMQIGDEIRAITKPWTEPTLEDYWFGGILDGEGSFASTGSTSINASQRPGAVWDRMLAYVRDRAYNYCIESDEKARLTKFGKVPVPKIVIGRMNELFRLLGQCRPTRFIGRRWWEGRDLPGKKTGDATASIVGMELLPAQRMIDLQTSTQTFIAEGFVSHNSTFEVLLKLDQALFNANFNGVVISDTRDNAGKLFAKAEFAYDHLPRALREALPLKGRESKSSMEFVHGSTVSVGTSARGGTVQDLHVSEMGEIASKRPAIAAEIVSGAFEAVPMGEGRIAVEATAKGADGEFYDLVMKALKRQQEGLPETPLDFRLHFFAWMGRAEYRMDPRTVLVSEEKHKYFDALQAKLGKPIDAWERAWYVKKEEGLGRKMKQEYPSTPEEAFEVAVDGAIYGDEMTFIREKGRILDIPLNPDMPVNTFWDLGANNYTALWLHQQIGMQNRFLKFTQDSGKGLGFYKQWLADWKAAQSTAAHPVQWGQHFVPHDADYQMLGEDTRTKKQILEQGANALTNIVVVPRISDLTVGIDLTRAALVKDAYFDKAGCDAGERSGIKALDAYRYEWDTNRGVWKDSPLKNWATDGADAIRQWAQAYRAAGPKPQRAGRRYRNHRTA